MTGDEPTVALVFSPEVWVEELHRHLAHHGGARVRQVVVEPSLALEEEYDVLVVSDRWPSLTLGLVGALHQRGRVLLGVFDPDEPAGKDHLLTLEVDATIAADSAMSDFVVALRDLATRRSPSSVRPTPPVLDELVEQHAHGSLVAVCGPRGSGVTEMALGVAMALAQRQRNVALVDAHESAPSLAGRLGLAVEPNLCVAVDACTHGLGSIDESLVRVAKCGRGTLDVVPGFPSAIASTHVTTPDVLDVVRVVRERRDVVVVDLEERSATARAVVESASAVVAVMAAHPVGIVRALEWVLEEVASAPVPVHVAVNRATRSRYRQHEIGVEVERTLRPATIGYWPLDRAIERAAWDGDPQPRGSFRAACAQLAGALDADRCERRKGRRR
jgi:MinD-like ATPase involved in chromosome partitioning or flagellar assembly